MQPDEVVLIRCFDSARSGPARFSAHGAFDDPETPDNAPPRESIEVRTLVFFEGLAATDSTGESGQVDAALKAALPVGSATKE